MAPLSQIPTPWSARLARSTPVRVMAAAAAVRAALAASLDVAEAGVVWVRVLDVVATLALTGAGLVLVISRVRALGPVLSRQVRGTLLVSYVLTGVVPAGLATIFCLLGALLLAFTTAGALVQSALQAQVEEARFLAEAVLLDVQRSPSTAIVHDTLARQQELLEGRVEGASVAVVHTPGRRCTATGARVVRSLPARLPIATGAWAHLAPPVEVPGWVHCDGAALWLALRDPVDGQLRLVVRAVAVPRTERPTFAVIVDVPVTTARRAALRRTTGVDMGAVASMSTSGPSIAPVSARGWPEAADGPTPAAWLPLRWTTFVDYRDWASGQTGSVSLALNVRLLEMLRRLAAVPSSEYGIAHVGQALLVLLVVAGALVLVVQLASLLAGVRLAARLTNAIDDLSTGTARLRDRDFTHEIPVRDGTELGVLASSFNAMTREITDLLADVASRERAEQELATARQIQRQLLPPEPLRVPGFAVAATCEPAREVGGDYYDCFAVGHGAAGVLVADVAGKGVGAALHMAQLKGVLLSLTHLRAQPRAMLTALNRVLAPALAGRTFITMAYAVVDPVAGRLTVVRAGHSPVVHVSGAARTPVSALAPPGMAIGLDTSVDGRHFSATLEEAVVPYAAGESIVLYTDGVSEAMNASGECFGDQRLMAALAREATQTPDVIGACLRDAVQRFAGDAPRHDDMTCVVLGAAPVGETAA